MSVGELRVDGVVLLVAWVTRGRITWHSDVTGDVSKEDSCLFVGFALVESMNQEARHLFDVTMCGDGVTYLSVDDEDEVSRWLPPSLASSFIVNFVGQC